MSFSYHQIGNLCELLYYYIQNLHNFFILLENTWAIDRISGTGTKFQSKMLKIWWLHIEMFVVGKSRCWPGGALLCNIPLRRPVKLWRVGIQTHPNIAHKMFDHRSTSAVNILPLSAETYGASTCWIFHVFCRGGKSNPFA